VGDIGPQGPQGRAGIDGKKGPKGIQGAQGPIGDRGPVGKRGPVGNPAPTKAASDMTARTIHFLSIQERIKDILDSKRDIQVEAFYSPSIAQGREYQSM
jgi:hypothetical protein